MSEPKELLMPPDDLIREWDSEYCYNSASLPGGLHRFLCSKAAQWGADKELEACCDWLDEQFFHRVARKLREARRPKPPSLKQQALEALNQADNRLSKSEWQQCSNIISRALEALPNE